MPLTYLTQEEKLRSLIYVSNNELSSDIKVQINSSKYSKYFGITM